MTRGVARTSHEVEVVRYLAGFGCGGREIARITGIPRGTVCNWLDGRAPRSFVERGCWRCLGLPCPDEGTYVYLLGLYLGDGHLAKAPGNKGVWRLAIAQDARYKDLIGLAAEAVGAMLPNTVSVQPRTGCVNVGAYSKHWPCLFPQHGPGRKHDRVIALEPWQEELVALHPRELLRGLVHSDGCRSMNTVVTRGKQYSYPRYQFTNASDDIRRIFTDTCDALGVQWTQMNARNVAISRREDVAFLDTFIGPKS